MLHPKALGNMQCNNVKTNNFPAPDKNLDLVCTIT
jgi:hypothetical protein